MEVTVTIQMPECYFCHELSVDMVHVEEEGGTVDVCQTHMTEHLEKMNEFDREYTFDPEEPKVLILDIWDGQYK